MKLFKEIPSPSEHIEISKANNAKWFTWSDEILNKGKIIESEAQKYGPPDEIAFQTIDNARTYSVDIKRINPVALKLIKEISEAFNKLMLKDELFFFDKIISEYFSSEAFRFLLSSIRAVLCTRRSDNMGSLYPPLSTAKPNNTFPIHCDFYIPTQLWNIFDEVPEGNQGTSLLLPVDVLLNKVIKSIPNFPQEKAAHVKNLFKDKVVNNDHAYYDLFSTLHNKENWWVNDISREIDKYVITLKLNRGQGYMVNDRKWLHGRGYTADEVTIKRLHRLLF
ncbi:MAG: hypothetical protein JO154_13495 [Chitinophaga sp.]|uniref:hypothetical protein n=1 Tax=Chitinophaga sp. TaxID=1869181 RepID=UPI0025BA28AE|nr:hypothetical protein [Chitinophaga sp.]MBV8253616.1 hypothetical protein [Chitinophaga sp.]